MAVLFSDIEDKSSFNKFILEEVAFAFFDSLDIGVKKKMANVTRFYNDYILPAIKEDLLFCYVQEKEIVGVIFADTRVNDSFYLEEKIIGGSFTYVSPKHRGCGIGKNLRKDMLRELKERGFKKATFEVAEENDFSLESFKKDVAHKTIKRFIVNLS